MTRVRTFVLLAAFASFLTSFAGPVVAATGTVTIGAGGADGEVGDGLRRLVTPDLTADWTPSGGCFTGSTPRLTEGYFENRFALEFALDALPADATVTGATLALMTVAPDVARETGMYGYAGDGTITGADMEVVGTPLLFTPATASREIHDVTALLTADVIAAGWAGFSLRQEPLVEDDSASAAWSCPRHDGFPILTIEYSVPDPEPTPTPTPSPTPAPTTDPTVTATPAPTAGPGAGMLPDTAVGAPSPAAWLAVVALASLLLLHWRRRVSRQ